MYRARIVAIFPFWFSLPLALFLIVGWVLGAWGTGTSMELGKL